MEYTLQELIAEWKMRKGLEPLRIDAAIKRQDAFEVDEYIRRRIDDWYERLLHDGRPELIEPTDITDDVNIDSFENGVAVMRLPDSCCRPIEVKMAAWERPAVIVDADSPTGRRQASPFSRGGRCRPVAVVEDGRRLRLYSFSDGDEPIPERVTGIMRPDRTGVYRCTPVALEMLFNNN